VDCFRGVARLGGGRRLSSGAAVSTVRGGRGRIGATHPASTRPIRRVTQLSWTPIDLALHEIRRDQLGQQSVLDRWLDLALITALRANGNAYATPRR
jgi:cupin